MIPLKNHLCSLHLWFCCKYCHGDKCVILIKHFGIYDFLKNYSCYWENLNTFSVLIFIQVCIDSLICLKLTKSFKFLTCLKLVKSVI